MESQSDIKRRERQDKEIYILAWKEGFLAALQQTGLSDLADKIDLYRLAKAAERRGDGF